MSQESQPFTGEDPPEENNHFISSEAITMPLVKLKEYDLLLGPSPSIETGMNVYDAEKDKFGTCLKVGHVRGSRGIRVTIKTRGRRNHSAVIGNCIPLPCLAQFVKRDGLWFKVTSIGSSGCTIIQQVLKQQQTTGR